MSKLEELKAMIEDNISAVDKYLQSDSEVSSIFNDGWCEALQWVLSEIEGLSNK